MLQCLHNCRLFFRWTLRYFGIFLLWQVIILPHIQPALALYLWDVEGRHLQSRMLQHIRFDLLIGCALLEPGHIHILQRELHPHFLRVDFSLGKQDDCLDVQSTSIGIEEKCKRGLSMTISLTLGNSPLPFWNGGFRHIQTLCQILLRQIVFFSFLCDKFPKHCFFFHRRDLLSLRFYDRPAILQSQ